MAQLEGRVSIVTGAGGAIAGAIARRFAAEGAAVLVCDIDGEAAGATVRAIRAAGGRAEAFAGDVSEPEAAQSAVEAALAAFDGVHVLVNAAAMREPAGDVVALPLADWQRALAINLTGVFLMCKYAVPRMIEAGGGSIVNIASQLGSVVVPQRPAYVTSKAAVIQLSKSMAVDFAKHSIRVNSLSPGATETARLTVRFPTMEAAREALVPLHPIGRLGQPEDIAAAALFLASDEARFVTGADLVVDGGYTAV